MGADESVAGPCRRGVPRGLIALNAALLGVLGASLWMGQAEAQPGMDRAAGRYVLLSGEAVGMTTDVVYILDTANQEVVAVRWDERVDRADVLGYRDLRADSERANVGR